jgi:hypothetical protein
VLDPVSRGILFALLGVGALIAVGFWLAILISPPGQWIFATSSNRQVSIVTPTSRCRSVSLRSISTLDSPRACGGPVCDYHVRFRLHLESVGCGGTGRVEACEPPRRLLVTTRETDESWRKGRSGQPFDATIQATLTAEGDQTILVIGVQGMPLDTIAAYGAGWQIHAENLAAYLAGRERGDS